jgi:hypothetical protein
MAGRRRKWSRPAHHRPYGHPLPALRGEWVGPCPPSAAEHSYVLGRTQNGREAIARGPAIERHFVGAGPHAISFLPARCGWCRVGAT